MKAVLVTGGAGKCQEGSTRQSSLSSAIFSGQWCGLPTKMLIRGRGTFRQSCGRGMEHLWVEYVALKALTCRVF